MKRRKFLQLLGLSPAAAVMPNVANAAVVSGGVGTAASAAVGAMTYSGIELMVSCSGEVSAARWDQVTSGDCLEEEYEED